jgi:hypothetical protein
LSRVTKPIKICLFRGLLQTNENFSSQPLNGWLQFDVAIMTTQNTNFGRVRRERRKEKQLTNYTLDEHKRNINKEKKNFFYINKILTIGQIKLIMKDGNNFQILIH